jgi:putative ABC transport system permease protein
MAIPLIYNFRSVRQRWTSSVVTVLGIAGTVGVFVAMLSLARGFKATLIASGTPDNAIIRRAGATSETDSSIPLEQIKIVEDMPGIASGPDGPLLSAETVVIASLPLLSTGTDANVQIRGVSPQALLVRRQIKITQGRFFDPGVTELVVGRSALNTYSGLSVGRSLQLGGASWRVVGVFDAGGSAFDSEVWCDAHVLRQTYHRPESFVQSATVHLNSYDSLKTFRDAVTSDPRFTLDVSRETEYYDKQSRTFTTLVTTFGGIVAFIMGIGAIFGSLNTMYSAVAERSREIATLRAIGFGDLSVVLSFIVETVLIAIAGGVIGCVAVLPLNGFTTGAMNGQTFSHLAFAFKVTPPLLVTGLIFALTMGLLGGILPALKAARQPIAGMLKRL